MERGGALGLAVLGLGAAGAVGAIGMAMAFAAMREEELPPEEEELPPEEEEPPPEEIIDAYFRKGHVWWEGLTYWERVNLSYLNEWPADTDITFSWEIKNTGNVGAYFQVYMFDPGEWLYLEPGDELEVFESFHTPVIPVSPGYEHYRITILGRKITGERVGAVWTSDEIEVAYV